MDGVAVIRRLHAHRMWADAQLRAAAGELSPEQLRQRFDVGRGSVWSSLVHLYSAGLVWLEALTGRADAPLAGDDAFETLEELQIAWSAMELRWRRYLDELTERKLDLPVHRKSTSFGAGRVWVTPASDVLLHVCTHAQYTSAQIVNMLRRLGVPPERLPDLQLIVMSRKERM